MVDTVTDTDQEQQDPQPPPKKLNTSDFAAKIKQKYPEYKDTPDDVLVQKIVDKYPQYKDQVDLTPPKKKAEPTPSQNDGSATVSTSLLPDDNSVQLVVSEVPKDAITRAEEANDLTKKVNDANTTDESESLGVSAKQEDDPVLAGQAKKLKDDLKVEGFKDDFIAGLKDFPKEAYNSPETSRETLIKTYKDNPLRFQQLTNEAKIKYGVRQGAYEQANNNLPDDENKQYLASQHGIIEGNKYSGDERTAPQNMQDIYAMIQDKQNLIDKNVANPQKRDELQSLLKETYASYINPETANFKDEYNNSEFKNELDINQYAGLMTEKLFDPSKYEQDAAIIKQKINPQYSFDQRNQRGGVQSINTPDSSLAASMGGGKVSDLTISQKIGQQRVLSELNNIGLNNTGKQIQQKRYDLGKQYDEAVGKQTELGIDTSDEQNKIKSDYLDTENTLNNLTTAQKLDDTRYPELSALKFDAQTKEALDNRGTGIMDRELNRFGHSWAGIPNGIEDALTSLFGSKEAKTNLAMQRVGEEEKYQSDTYLPESERKTGSPFTYQFSDGFKNKIQNALGSNDYEDATPEQKENIRKIIADNQNNIKTITNPDAGKSKNFLSKSTAIDFADFTTDVGAFLSQMEGFKGIGLGTKLAEATTLFKDGYVNSFNQNLKDGKSVDDAHSDAILDGSVSAVMAAVGSKYEDMKSILSGGKSRLSQEIAGLSKEAWDSLVEKNKSLASRLGSSLKNSLLETGKNSIKFGAIAPTLHDAAHNMVDSHKSIHDILNDAAGGAMDMFRSSLGFAAMGAITGSMKYNATPLEKSAVWDLGDNPDIGKQKIDEAVSKGDLSVQDGEIRKKAIDEVAGLVNKVPQKNDKGKDLNDTQKQDYLYNLVTQKRATEKAKELPDKQAEEHDMVAEVAKHKNALMLSTPTEKQLQARKDTLEKSLIPEKDSEGKNIEIPPKEIFAAKAEIKAIDDVLDAHAKNKEVDTKLSQPIEGLDEQGVPIGDNVPKPTETKNEGKIIQTDNAIMYGSYGNEAKVGDKTVKLPKDGLYISHVELKNGAEKGKGSGQDIYMKALKEHGRLYSTSDVFPISEDAQRVQDTLEKKGLIKIREEKIDGVNFKVIESTVKNESTEPIKEGVEAGGKGNEPIPSTEKSQPNEDAATEGEGKAVENDLPFGKSDKTGIAHSIQEERAYDKNSLPPERGEGVTVEEAIQHGQDLLAKGGDAYKAAEEFKQDKKISYDALSLVRAEHEELTRATNKAIENFGENSKEAKEASKKEDDFYRDNVKPMQTEWSKIGQAQQGAVDIDTGTYTGLRRAFKQSSDKDFDPKQASEAKEHATRVQALTKEVESLKKKLSDTIDKSVSDENNSKSANIKEKAKSIADTIRKGKLSRPDTFSAASPASLVWDGALEVSAKTVEGLGTVAQAIADGVKHIKESDWYKSLTPEKKIDAENAFSDYFKNTINNKDIFTRFISKTDNKFTTEEVKAIWEYAKKEYLDKGKSYNDMLSGVSTDLGLNTKQVREAISQPKGAREITDELYRKQDKRLQAVNKAKEWVKTTNTPPLIRFFKALPRFFFGLKVFGHGTVGAITHAGMNIFQPSRWKQYFPFFIKQFKYAFGSTSAYLKAMEDLKNDPDFTFWQRAGLAVDPKEVYDDYQGASKMFGRLGVAGDRGFNALKVYRLSLAKSFYDGLSVSEKADTETAKEIAKLVNHSTGTSEVKIPKWANTVFFAPKLEASRWQGLITDPAKAIKTFATWDKSSLAERAAAKRVAKSAGEKLATYSALLAANAGFLAATGSNQKINFTDPLKTDWLKFKAGDKTIDVTGGMTSTMRFLASLIEQAHLAYTGDKKDLRTKPQDKDYQSVGQQMRYKMSPYASTITDLVTGQDAVGRPLPWSNVKPKKGESRYSVGEYLSQQQTPIPIAEGIKETIASMKERGMSDASIKDILKGIMAGAIAGGTGAKVADEPKK